MKVVVACFCHDLHEHVADLRLKLALEERFVMFCFVVLTVVGLHEDGNSRRGARFNIGVGKKSMEMWLARECG